MAPPVLLLGKGQMVMDGHLLTPPFFSIWNRWPHLRGRSLVIGIIGPRGSGKSTTAARILTLDYLLKRKPVWSNMRIEVNLLVGTTRYPLQSMDTRDPDFRIANCHNGVIFNDEVNEDKADAWRSMTNESLEFSYDVQELRKNHLDLIWTTQSETFANPRLRFQTDIIIRCADISIKNKKVGIGEYSQWEMWDYSGIVTGNITGTKLKDTPIIFTKPWWHVFNTDEKQREKKLEAKQRERAELYELASAMAQEIKENGKVRREKLWREWKVTERRQQIAIGQLLSSAFDITLDYQRRYYRVDEELAGV